MVENKIVVHASEGLTHWYTADGSPVYEVESAKGGMRPATLRDARKLNLLPSVTGIIKCAAAPGLESWKQKQVMLAALTLPREEGESESDWLDRIMRDSREQARKAAERGTAIHAAIQRYFEGEMPVSYNDQAYIGGVTEALWAVFGPSTKFVAERSFAYFLGYGGKVDLSADNIVIDFKTKEFDEDTKLDVYEEHVMQLAAYRNGLGMPDARCAICYVSVTVPGLSRVLEIEQRKLGRGWIMFCSLLTYWQSKNNYFPKTLARYYRTGQSRTTIFQKQKT